MRYGRAVIGKLCGQSPDLGPLGSGIMAQVLNHGTLRAIK